MKKLILMLSLIATPVLAQNYYLIERQPSLGQLWGQSQSRGFDDGLMIRQREENDMLRHRLMMMERGQQRQRSGPIPGKIYTFKQVQRMSMGGRWLNFKGGCMIDGAWTKHSCVRVKNNY